MDTFLAIASRREVREYEPRALPPEVEERILDAGRLSGSAKNRQPWRFVVIESRDTIDQIAPCLVERFQYRPHTSGQKAPTTGNW